MGRITSTQAIFFSPGTNWAGEKEGKKNNKKKKTDKDKGWMARGKQQQQSSQEAEGRSKSALKIKHLA